MSEHKKGVYELLKKKHEQTDWNDLNSIKEYNKYARQLLNHTNN